MALKGTQEPWKNTAQPITRNERPGPSEVQGVLGALVLELALITGCACIGDQNQSCEAELSEISELPSLVK